MGFSRNFDALALNIAGAHSFRALHLNRKADRRPCEYTVGAWGDSFAHKVLSTVYEVESPLHDFSNLHPFPSQRNLPLMVDQVVRLLFRARLNRLVELDKLRFGWHCVLRCLICGIGLIYTQNCFHVLHQCFRFLLLVAFLVRSKPKVPFRRLCLWRTCWCAALRLT